MTFRFDKLTTKAQEAVQTAQAFAQNQGHPELDSLHVLAALLAESDGIVGPLLDKIGTDRSQLGGMIESELDRFPKVTGAEVGINRGLRDALSTASNAAEGMGDDFVSTEHLLFGLCKSDCKAKNLFTAQRCARKRCAHGHEGTARRSTSHGSTSRR